MHVYTAPIPRDRLIITCLFVCLGGTSYKKKKKTLSSRYRICKRGRGDFSFFFAVTRCMRSLRIVVIAAADALSAACIYRPLNVVCLLSSSPCSLFAIADSSFPPSRYR